MLLQVAVRLVYCVGMFQWFCCGSLIVLLWVAWLLAWCLDLRCDFGFGGWCCFAGDLLLFAGYFELCCGLLGWWLWVGGVVSSLCFGFLFGRFAALRRVCCGGRFCGELVPFPVVLVCGEVYSWLLLGVCGCRYILLVWWVVGFVGIWFGWYGGWL